MSDDSPYAAAFALAGPAPSARDLDRELTTADDTALADALKAWSGHIRADLRNRRVRSQRYILAELAEKTQVGKDLVEDATRSESATAALAAYLKSGGFNANRTGNGAIEVTVPHWHSTPEPAQ